MVIMDNETVSEALASTPEAKPEKKPRAYSPRKPKIQPSPAPPVIVPETPNPAVVKLQESILGLVEMRSGLQQHLVETNVTLRNAQACAESARERLQAAESEVQYRLQLISQMQGHPANYAITHQSSLVGLEVAPYTTPYVVSGSGGIGSIPPARPVNPGIQGDVRRETAEMERAAI